MRISATKASRSFSLLLDQVAAGKKFVVSRHGEDVCLLAAPPVEGRRVRECIALLRARTRVELDDAFSDDLAAVIAGEGAEVQPSWGS